MASIYLAKISFFNVSRIFPRNPSLPLRFSSTAKISRGCFTSASKFSEDSRNAAEEMGEAGDRMKKTMKGGIERAKEKGREAKDTTSERTSSMSEKAKDTVKEGMESAKEKATEVKEKTSKVARSTGDKAKQGTEKATEMAQNIGEKAKKTVLEAWGAAKETSQKIKETVVGKDEKDEGDCSTTDDEIEEPKKRARGHGGKSNDWK